MFRRPSADEARNATSLGDRQPPRARRAVLGLAVLGLLASVLALVPAAPAQAAPRPILIVGGHSNQTELMEQWADHVAPQIGLSPNLARGVELATAPGWDIPGDDYDDWPGTASNETSAADIHDAIDDLYAAAGNTPIDVIAVSQGALATRWLLQENPSSVRDKVAGYVSFSGVNAGIPDTWYFSLCDGLNLAPACNEMVYEALPGDNNWIEYQVNMWRYVLGIPEQLGDPTPGSIDYFHVYTANDGDSGFPPPEVEGQTPYGWSVPLLGAANRSAQDDCGTGYVAPHGGWTGSTPDPVMEHLLIDALNRNPLDAPSNTC